MAGVLGTLQLPSSCFRDSPPGLSYIGPSYIGFISMTGNDLGTLFLPFGGACNLNSDDVAGTMPGEKSVATK